MSVKFKSQATADLLMLQAPAEALLRLLGKGDSLGQGILEVKDMPAALRVLHAITDERVELPPSAPVAEPSDDADDERAPAFGDEPVSLRQRAWPFIQMIERALAADKPIVWGV